MKHLSILVVVLMAATANSTLLQRNAKKLNQKYRKTHISSLPDTDQKPKDRKLYETLVDSFLQKDSRDPTTLNALNLLIEEESSRRNFKRIGGWLTSYEKKLDDLRNTVNRKLTDMAVGLQRKNQVMLYYHKRDQVQRLMESPLSQSLIKSG